MVKEPYQFPGPKRIAAALLLAGFPEEKLVEMVAVHGAETSGNVWAVSRVNANGTRDYGAFQISAHEPPDNWADYFVNCRMAVALWKVQGFGAWYGHKNIDVVKTGWPGLYGHPTWSWRDWARAGVSQMQRELTKGRELHQIASMYYLMEGL